MRKGFISLGRILRRTAGVVMLGGIALLIHGRGGNGAARALNSSPLGDVESGVQGRPEEGIGLQFLAPEDGHAVVVYRQESNVAQPDLSELENRSPKTEADWIQWLRTWCEQDPEAMTTWVVTHLVGSERETALKQAAIVWIGNDLEAAIRWAESLVGEVDRNTVLIEMGFELARLRPERAVDLISRLPETRSRDEILIHAVQQWVGIDPSSASVWASRLPESRLRQEVLSALAVSLAVDSGADAAEVVALLMTVEKNQEDAAVLVARNWGTVDPEASANWIVRFPDRAIREAAMEGLLAGWSSRTPDQMSAWIESLTDKSLRHEILALVGSSHRHADASGQDPAVDVVP